MLYTIGGLWRLLIILKPILTIEQSRNIYNWAVIRSLICWEKLQSQHYFAADEESGCIRKKYVGVNSTGHNLDASFL